MDTQEIFGVRAIIECIEANQNLEKVFLLKDQRSPLFKQLENLLRDKKVAHSYVPIERLDRFSNKNHQGAVATISPIKFLSIDDLSEILEKKKDSASILILDQISDVRNFGAIVRTAECTAVDCIIVQSNGSAPVNGDTIKTSSGAVFNVPICKVGHIKDAIFLLKQFEVPIYGASEKAEKTIYQTNFKKSQATVMGSEGKGLSTSVINLCDQLIKIPLLGKIESLNVSVACGTILYEIVRQKNH